MGRVIVLLAVAVFGCATSPPQPVAPLPVAAVAELVGAVATDWGWCGAVRTGTREVMTAGHCVRGETAAVALDGQRWLAAVARRTTLGDLVTLTAPPADRVAAIGWPEPGESLLVVAPGRHWIDRVRARELAWAAVELEGPAWRGDSGASAWRASGELACILTGAEVTTRRAYCEIPEG